jgi:hypothetical protein
LSLCGGVHGGQVHVRRQSEAAAPPPRSCVRRWWSRVSGPGSGVRCGPYPECGAGLIRCAPLDRLRRVAAGGGRRAASIPREDARDGREETRRGGRQGGEREEREIEKREVYSYFMRERGGGRRAESGERRERTSIHEITGKSNAEGVGGHVPREGWAVACRYCTHKRSRAVLAIQAVTCLPSASYRSSARCRKAPAPSSPNTDAPPAPAPAPAPAPPSPLARGP